MKILIASEWYAPVVNGVVTSVLNLQHQLEARGHEVRVLTLSSSSRSFAQEQVRYIGSLSAGKIYPNARVALRLRSHFVQELLRWQPDIIHTQCEFSTFVLAKTIARRLGIPIVHTYHTVYEDYTRMFSPSEHLGRVAVAKFSEVVLQHTDAVIAPTEKIKHLLQDYGVTRPIHVIPTGLDLTRFAPLTAQQVQAKRAALGLPAGAPVLVYLGRLSDEKNVDELLHYFAQLPPGPVMAIVGDGPEREKLEKLAETLGVRDRVYFTGMVPPQEVGDYYQLGDIFVCASTSEAQGLTYIEALASGVPVLCRRDACLDSVVHEGENGWQYTDFAEFAARLQTVLGNASLRQKMADAARAGVQARYSAQAFAAQVEQVYREAIEAKRLQLLQAAQLEA